jgi:hypothetical protein
LLYDSAVSTYFVVWVAVWLFLLMTGRIVQ